MACKTPLERSLAVTSIAVAAEWHPTRNNGLTPSDVFPCSKKKAWWLGSCGHEWQSAIQSRTRRGRGRGCPYCSGQRVCNATSLATLRSDLASEWHPTRNGDLTPSDVTANSGKRVWWLAACGHEWCAAIVVRTKQGTGCPYCAGQRVCNENCLATLFPDIAAEWHPTLNELLPDDVTARSGDRKAWWKCRVCGHEWCAVIADRTTGNKGCPVCRESHGEKRVRHVLQILKDNDLIISFCSQYRHPEIKSKQRLPFDFGVKFNDGTLGLIEYNGSQHYRLWKRRFNYNTHDAEKALIATRYRDGIKRGSCSQLGIPLLVIKYTQFENIESITQSWVMNSGKITRRRLMTVCHNHDGGGYE